MHHVNAMLRAARVCRSKLALLLPLLLPLFPVLQAQAREQVRVVGSSTLFPFASVVAENFARNSPWKAPVVESTGTGGGFKLFCRGAGADTPDITDASRPMSDGERQECARNRVGPVVGIRVGSDGIIIASRAGSGPLHLTREHLYRATAKTVAVADRLIANPYRRWVDIDASLPNRPIIVYGPAPNHGTRDAFAALAMAPPCERLAPIRKMSRQEQQQACQAVREDGVWIDVAADYRSLLSRLANDQNAVAILTFSYLTQNRNLIQAASVDGIEPSFESIGAWTYPLSRPLFLYVKQAHVGLIPGLAEYVQEFTSERAAGAHGYLVDQGLGPLPPGFLKAERAKAMALGGER